MAGINLMLKRQLIQKSNFPWHNTALFSLPQNYQQAYIFSLNKLYATYPIRHIALVNAQAIIEGMVYNTSEAQIQSVLIQCIVQAVPDITALRQAVAGWSGEWCLWVQAGSQLYIINDSLARLPMYWYKTDTHFFAGRHLGLLADEGLLIPDKMGIASQLWSSYLIGNRTIYKNLSRLPGGSVIEIALPSGQAIVTYGQSYNFDERSGQPLQQQADNLAALFRQGCNRIAESWPGLINISQSGGQDSRAVAVGFREAINDDRLLASSFIMRGAEKDAMLGKQIANALHIPFNSYHVRANDQYVQELLANKMGLNYVAMAFIHDFYKQMLQKDSSFLYVTGDGGDKALPYLGEKNPNISLDQLVMQLSRRHATTPLETVASLMNIAPDDIRHIIHETVARYPEQKINNKSIHFTIYERAGTSMYEGEDRSRYFAWSTTPFYDLDFFKAAMMVPDVYKKHYTIYRPFQNALSRTIANIPDASGYSINTWKFMARKRVQELFRSAPPTVKNIVRKLGGVAISVNQGTPAEHADLLNTLQQFSTMAQLLPADKLKFFFTTANQEQYEYVRTLILLQPFLKKAL